MSTLGIPTTGGADGVTVIKQGFNVDPLIQKQADCISTMTYNEYWQVIDAGIPADQLVVFKYEDQGVATLEDGLYVLEDKLKDPAFVDTMAKFVAASMKGWDYARANGDERPRSFSTMMPRAPRPSSIEAHDGRDQQAHRRLRRHARRGRRRSHRRHPDEGRLRSVHHQEAGRRLDLGGHRQGQGHVTKILREGGESSRLEFPSPSSSSDFTTFEIVRMKRISANRSEP